MTVRTLSFSLTAAIEELPAPRGPWDVYRCEQSCHLKSEYGYTNWKSPSASASSGSPPDPESYEAQLLAFVRSQAPSFNTQRHPESLSSLIVRWTIEREGTPIYCEVHLPQSKFIAAGVIRDRSSASLRLPSSWCNGKPQDGRSWDDERLEA